jgi:hypothetical protein
VWLAVKADLSVTNVNFRLVSLPTELPPYCHSNEPDFTTLCGSDVARRDCKASFLEGVLEDCTSLQHDVAPLMEEQQSRKLPSPDTDNQTSAAPEEIPGLRQSMSRAMRPPVMLIIIGTTKGLTGNTTKAEWESRNVAKACHGLMIVPRTMHPYNMPLSKGPCSIPTTMPRGIQHAESDWPAAIRRPREKNSKFAIITCASFAEPTRSCSSHSLAAFGKC